MKARRPPHDAGGTEPGVGPQPGRVGRGGRGEGRKRGMMRPSGKRVGLGVAVAGALSAAGCGGWGSTPSTTVPELQGVRITVAAVGDPGVLPTVNAQRG